MFTLTLGGLPGVERVLPRFQVWICLLRYQAYTSSTTWQQGLLLGWLRGLQELTLLFPPVVPCMLPSPLTGKVDSLIVSDREQHLYISQIVQ